MEPRPRTVQARFGFADPELRDPTHDAIVQWVADNIEDVLMLTFELPSRPQMKTPRWEPPVMTRSEGGVLIGFADLQASFRCEDSFPHPFRHGVQEVLVEAKVTIPSLGELFRQLRMYREGFVWRKRVDEAEFIVCCPDATHADVIRGQGFRFLRYDPGRAWTLGGV